MRNLFIASLVACGLLALPACAGGVENGDDMGMADGGSTGSGDGTGADGGGIGADASPTGSSALGQPCTWMEGLVQSDCPTGYVCLPTDNPFCSKVCDDDVVCTEGYDGPGQAGCYLGLDTDGNLENGAEHVTCGIICEDSSGTCSGACDGTCPQNLQCTATLVDNDGNEVGKGCQ